MLISLKLKEMIILLKTNKELIHTIQTILQVFPEGVIIRSLDETSQQIITKFANNISNKEFIEKENREIKINICGNQSFNEEWRPQDSLSLEELLTNQEIKLEQDSFECFEQMIWVKGSIDQLQERFNIDQESAKNKEENFFNIKSIKVNWENNKESFMHVFINITEVKKLEEERANREYQHMMFSSLSHELRTPLNAFSNSLSLIQFTF